MVDLSIWYEDVRIKDELIEEHKLWQAVILLIGLARCVEAIACFALTGVASYLMWRRVSLLVHISFCQLVSIGEFPGNRVVETFSKWC